MPKSIARTTPRTTLRTTPRTDQPIATSRPASTIPPARPSHTAGISGLRPANGTVRACTPQRGELLRHRVMTADGKDVAVTTIITVGGYTTAAYPVQNGYLVMVCQPLFEANCATAEAARAEHEQLVRVLAELGVRVVRARRLLERSESHESVEVVERAAPAALAISTAGVNV